MFKKRKNRLLFGRIVHYMIEFIAKEDEIQKILTDYSLFKDYIIKDLFYGLPQDEKILKYAWTFVRSKFKFNLINFIKKLKKQGFKVLSEIPLFYINPKDKGKINVEKIIKPDLLFINQDKKKIVVIEIKSGKKYLSYKRQIKKYKKYLDLLYPNYEKEFYLYVVSKDELQKF